MTNPTLGRLERVGLREIWKSESGEFITTADYQGSARDVVTEVGFPRVGLINGRQLVDLLVQYWASISDEFEQQLDLALGLVRA